MAILLASCGDNLPITWGDAETVWSEAWCSYADRCFPDLVAATYGADCVDQVTRKNCAVSYAACSATYPVANQRCLEQCRLTMEALVCSAYVVPTVCVAAFE